MAKKKKRAPMSAAEVALKWVQKCAAAQEAYRRGILAAPHGQWRSEANGKVGNWRPIKLVR